MDVVSLFFSGHGRIRRSTWWYAHIGLAIAFVAAMGVFYVTGSRVMDTGLNDILPGGRAWTNPAILPQLLIIGVCTWSSACLDIKRWHDRGRPWAFVFISLLPQINALLHSLNLVLPSGLLTVAVETVAAIGGLWALIECGFLAGKDASNTYGPSPAADPGAAI